MAATVAVSVPWYGALEGAGWSTPAVITYPCHDKPEAPASGSTQNLASNRRLLIGSAGCFSLVYRRAARVSVRRRQQALTKLSEMPVQREKVETSHHLPLGEQAPKLHEKQREALEEIVGIFEAEAQQRTQQQKRVVLRGVPGSGKTLVAASVISELSRRVDCKAALILAPMKELTHQIHSNFEKFFDLDQVAVTKFVSMLRGYRGRSIGTSRDGEQYQVKRSPSERDEEIEQQRNETVRCVEASQPCVICGSTSTIYPGNVTGGGAAAYQLLSKKQRDDLAKTLRQELSELSKRAEGARTLTLRPPEYEENLERLHKTLEVHAEEIERDGKCRDMYEFYCDLLSPQSLIQRLDDKFGDEWLLVIDECHTTWPMLTGASRAYATRVQKHVDAGRMREGLIPRPAEGHRGGGPLPVQELEKLLPRFVLNMSATPRGQDVEEACGVVSLHHRPTNIPEPSVTCLKLKAADTEEQKITYSKHDIWTLLNKCTELLDSRDQDEHAIISCITNKQAEVLWAALKARGYSAGIVHSMQDPDTKKQMLREFREGIIDVLLGSKSLIEGMDFPDVAMVIVPDACQGQMFRTEQPLKQLIGRASRNTKGRAHLLYTEDEPSDLVRKVAEDMNRLREEQEAYNKEKGVTPTCIGVSEDDNEEEERARQPYIRKEVRTGKEAAVLMMAHVLKQCSFKKCFQAAVEEESSDAWMHTSLQMVLEEHFDDEDPKKALEHIAIMATGRIIGPDRSKNLVDEFGTIDSLTSKEWTYRTYAETEFIGEIIGAYLADPYFRKTLLDTRSKLVQVYDIARREMVQEPDLDPNQAIWDQESYWDQVETSLRPEFSSRAVRFLTCKLLQLAYKGARMLQEEAS